MVHIGNVPVSAKSPAGNQLSMDGNVSNCDQIPQEVLCEDDGSLELETWTWKKVYSTVYSFAHLYSSSQPRLLSRQETLIKVHVHRLHKGHQWSKGVYQCCFIIHPMSMFTCFEFRMLELSHRYQCVLKKKHEKQTNLKLIRPMDNETEYTCDSRYKMSIFPNKFVVGTGLHEELNIAWHNYCI